jgi:hypothetical protein
VLSWLEATAPGRMALKVSRREGRRAWATASTVAEADDFFANWADVPSVVPLSDGRLAAHWLRRSGTGRFAYHVVMSVSGDGSTWSPPSVVHRDRSDTEHGFLSFFELPGDRLGMVWLDGRNMAGAGHGDGHGSTGGAMTLRSAVLDRDGRMGDEQVLDDRVCECCPTAAVATQRGAVVAYRDRGATETRDIAVARLEDGRWTTPAVAHPDGWKIAACPVNGPSLAARGRQVALAWFTAQGDRPRVSIAFSQDEGRSFGRPVAINDTSALGRVAVELLEDGSALVGWMETSPPAAAFRVRRAWPDGRTSKAVEVSSVSSTRSSGYPRLARDGTRLVAAWTEAGPPSRVRLAEATLP